MEKTSKVSKAVHHQHLGTCYAHAVATTIASVERRIAGRTPMKHEDMVSDITKKHGFNGGYVSKVLEEECGKRNLHFKELLSDSQAKEWLKNGHAILASFHLEGNQWTNLNNFLRNNPKGILTKEHISDPIKLKDDKKAGGDMQ